MKVHTQHFVVLTDLFQNCPALSELFHEDDHSNITWGGAIRTMIAPNEVLLWAEKIQGEPDFWNEEYDPDEIEKEVDRLQSRVWALEKDGVLVDLEN